MKIYNNYHIKILKEIESYKPWDSEEKEAKEKIVEYLKTNNIIIDTENKDGHLTASAWIVNSKRDKILMTHHKILDIWIQLGGHTNKGETAFIAALREGYEESGLKTISEVNKDIFDLDVHYFPETRKNKAHYHYDIRYLFEANENDEIVVSNESKDVKWISFEDLYKFTDEKALQRMMEKAKLK